MTEAEITGHVAVQVRAVGVAQDATDGHALQCVSAPFLEFTELALIERARQHVLYGHDAGKSLETFVSILTEEVGEVARAVNEFVAGEEGQFENLQIELVQTAATAAAFFESTMELARVMLDHGAKLPVLAAMPAAQLEAGEMPAEYVGPKPILAFTGGRGAGKDSVAAHLIKQYGFRKGSFAAPLKRLVCAEYGWDMARMDELSYKEEFVPEIGMTRREMLILVGTTWFRSVDPLHWIKRSAPDFVATLADPTVKGLAVTDLRFDNEVTELRKQFPANPVVVIRVVRSDDDGAPNADDAVNSWRTIPADAVWSAAYGQLPLLYAQADLYMQVFGPFAGGVQ